MFPWMLQKNPAQIAFDSNRIGFSYGRCRMHKRIFHGSKGLDPSFAFDQDGRSGDFSAGVRVQECGEWVSKDQEENACMSAFLYSLRNHRFVKLQFMFSPGFLSHSERGILSAYTL